MHFLKFILLSSFLFFISCDDGDILISDFQFDTDDMDFCYSEVSDDTVFYNYNSINTEVIYLILEGTEYDGEEEARLELDVGNSTIVEYIKFNSEIDAEDYFCTAVATGETIERKLTGENGTINIETTNEIELEGDADGDGLSNQFEGFVAGTMTDNFNDLPDDDNDGIPNFLDEDDDNDNVKTSLEIFRKDQDQNDIIPENIEELGIRLEDLLDTDKDGMPDYLDEDDDEDGVLTRFEFNPDSSSLPASNRNDDGLPFYRDSSETENNTQDVEISYTNSYSIEYRTIVTFSDLELADSDSSTTYTDFFLGEDSVTTNTQNRIVLKTDGTFDVFSLDDNGGNSPDAPINSDVIGLQDEDAN